MVHAHMCVIVVYTEPDSPIGSVVRSGSATTSGMGSAVALSSAALYGPTTAVGVVIGVIRVSGVRLFCDVPGPNITS